MAINYERPLSEDAGGLRPAKKGPPELAEPQLAVTPFHLSLGGAAPATASAIFSRSNYHLESKGEVDVDSLSAFIDTLGVPQPQMDPLTKRTAQAARSLSAVG